MNAPVLLSIALRTVFPALETIHREPIVTDRPDFTESAIVVPKGLLQLETGLTYQNTRSGASLVMPEALLRLGAWARTEIRIGLPSYGSSRSAGTTRSGFRDTYLGAKFQVGPLANGNDLAFIPAVSLPSGEGEFSSGSVDPELKVCWSQQISSIWTLSLMSYGLWTTAEDGRRLVFQQTASFGRELSPRLAVFLEYAGSFEKSLVPDHVAHCGIVYRLSIDQQFDLHGGISVTGDRRPFLAAGYSVRW